MTRYLQACFILIFSAIVITSCKPAEPKPQAQQGVLDLRNYDFKKSGLIKLTGQWRFYWKRFYQKHDVDSITTAQKKYIFLPQNWNAYEHQGAVVGGQGYATYHLRVKLPQKKIKLSIKMPVAGTSYALYIDNRLSASGGKTGTSKAETTPAYNPEVIDFVNQNQSVDIIIHMANFHHHFGGGWREIYFGLKSQIKEKQKNITITDFFLLGSIVVIALYHLGIYFIRRKSVSALYFSFICFIAALRITTTGEYWINSFVSVSWDTIIRLEYVSVSLGPLIFGLFIYSLFPREYPKKILLVQVAILGTISAITIFFPPIIFAKMLRFSQVFVLLACLYLIFVLVKAAIRKREGALLFVIGFLAIFAAILNDVLYTTGVINTGHQFAVGLFIFIFSQALVLSLRFSKAFTQTEELSEKLNYTNKNLENLVGERTEELQQTNHRLNESVEELDVINTTLNATNEVINKTNKDITDSINYASNIQQAMLPMVEIIEKAIPEHFILYKPRNIVSGDFYWFTRVLNEESGAVEKVIFAVVDCTGHGVPGAFMSMLGIQSLDNIVNQQKITEPQDILTQLHEHIFRTLRKRLNSIRDGMDLALCTIDFTNASLTFAGAHNSLILVQNGELKTIKGSPISIGSPMRGRLKAFEQHTVSLKGSNTVYMFSDGFQDQFGGKDDRKFMKKRFRELLYSIHQNSTTDQKQTLDETIENWIKEANQSQTDDILVVGLQLNF